jgi:hypothetical protein
VRRTTAELRAISDDLLYELQMLFQVADALRDDIQGDAPGAMPWATRMACIEAFVIHARVLRAFLWDPPRKGFPDDALAVDFFDDGVWEAIRENVQDGSFEGFRARAGAEIAHLSYRRTLGATDREWRFDVIAGVIGNAMRLFLANVSGDLLCTGFEERLRATWPTYLNHSIAMSFPPNCDEAPAH